MRGAAFRNWVAAPPHDFVVMPMALLVHGATTFNLRALTGMPVVQAKRVTICFAQ